MTKNVMQLSGRVAGSRTANQQNRKLSKVLLVGAIAMLTVGATGCASNNESAGETGPRIAYFIASNANTYAVAMGRGVELAAGEAEATVKVFDGQFDPAVQLNQIQDATASGNFDAFVINAIDGVGVVPVVEAAIASGIKVATVLQPLGADQGSGENQIEGQVVTVLQSPHAQGVLIGEQAIQACEGIEPCKVAYLLGSSVSAFEQAKLEGFELAIAEQANIDLVSIQEGGYLADPARTTTQNILQANPDLNVIASVGDQMISGAELALDDAGLAGKVSLIGMGASKIGVAALEENRWFSSIVALPEDEGRIATEAVIASILGAYSGPAHVDAVDNSPIGPVATPENIGNAGFRSQWDG